MCVLLGSASRAVSRFLQLKLPARDAEGPLRLDEEVALTHIHRKKTFDGDIALQAGDEFALKAPTDVGTSKAKDEQIKLSQIIDLLNERFGTDFRPEDEISLEQFVADAKADDDIRRKAKANKFENFALALREPMQGIMIDRMERNEHLVTRYLNDKDFANVLFKWLAQRIYDELRAE